MSKCAHTCAKRLGKCLRRLGNSCVDEENKEKSGRSV